MFGRENTPKISVVIPLYNKEANIRQTIQSVLDQTFQEFEIVVVNDGSTDNSRSIVASIPDERIRLFDQANGGVSKARNTGINEAQADWIALLDADDIWLPSYLDEMISAIALYPKSAMIGSGYYVLSSGVRKKRSNSLNNFFSGYIDNYFNIAINDSLFWTSATIINKKKTIEVGGFDERQSKGEDLDLWIRLNLAGRSAFLNKPLAVYNQDGQNRLMHRKDPFSMSYYAYFDKYSSLIRSNDELNRFITFRAIRDLPAIMYHYVISKDEWKSIRSLSLKARTHNPVLTMFALLPFSLQKFFSHLFYMYIR